MTVKALDKVVKSMGLDAAIETAISRGMLGQNARGDARRKERFLLEWLSDAQGESLLRAPPQPPLGQIEFP
jgi:hypothetical protein